VAELPDQLLDFMVISHSHWDHLDMAAVRALAVRFPRMKWFVPTGLGTLLTEEGGVSGDRVEEMTWGEMKTLEVQVPDGGNSSSSKKSVTVEVFMPYFLLLAFTFIGFLE
jgi:L-ascorbate metabolism protein UlaG (beta-lactamase superfamily)